MIRLNIQRHISEQCPHAPALLTLKVRQREIFSAIVTEYTDWQAPTHLPVGIRDSTLEALQVQYHHYRDVLQSWRINSNVLNSYFVNTSWYHEVT